MGDYLRCCVMLSPHPAQALDGAFNEENRERCRAATAPLIEAVDNLTAFASNPEFATVPAQISPEVSRAWGPSGVVAPGAMGWGWGSGQGLPQPRGGRASV